jgi:hypothetical protein
MSKIGFTNNSNDLNILTLTNMKKHLYLILCFSTIGIINSCGTTSTYQPRLENQESQKAPFDKLYWGAVSKIPSGMTLSEYKKILASYESSPEMQKQNELFHAVLNSKSWQEAHKYAQAFIQSIENKPYTFIMQPEVAATMLRSIFIKQNSDPDYIDAISFYMDILDRHQYRNEANLFAYILPKLTGHWSNEKISSFAQKCANANISAHELIEVNFSTSDNYFLNQAKAQTIKTGGNNTQSVNSTNDIQESAKLLKQKFISEIPTKLTNLENRIQHQKKWLSPSLDAVIILSIIAENTKK